MSTSNDRHMSTPATLHDLNNLEHRLERRIAESEQRLERVIAESEQRQTERIAESEQRLGQDLARHAGAIQDNILSAIRVVDDQYRSLPAQIAPLQTLPARVEALEQAVFGPAPRRRRQR
jgi:tetrahydromethanopterin S-methyltransferase subunit G